MFNPGDEGGPPLEIANRRFVLQQRIGGGIFAEVYRGLDRATGRPVAIKLEDCRDGELQLEREAEFLAALAEPELPQGFAQCFHCCEEGLYTCMVMDLLGPSLEDHLQTCGGSFTVTTTALIAEQGLTRLRYLHSRGIIHRDIKPENFVMGLGSRVHHLYLIDLGLSKYYYKGQHIPIGSGVGMVGTPRYASINALKGNEQSRRDDLESFGYMLTRFCRGSLPWSGLGGDTQEEKHRRILGKKERTTLSELCAGMPNAFATYLEYTRHLGFKEMPDYDQLFALWADLRAEGQPVQDHEFQWLEGQNAGRLEALELAEDVKQPDERVSDSQPQGVAALFGWLMATCSISAPLSNNRPRLVDSDEWEVHQTDVRPVSDASSVSSAD